MSRDTLKYLLSAIASVTACIVGAIDPGAYLTPACTTANPYSFINKAGISISLPDAANYKEWTVYNASTPTSEVAQSYTMAVTAAADTTYGGGMLKLKTSDKDDTSYLALLISADTDTHTPWPMTSTGANVLATHSVSLKTYFIPCDATPDIDDLLAMYKTYEERDNLGAAVEAAKAAIVVKTDGYFYVARASAGKIDEATGVPASFVYEFVKSPVSYADVGGGAVNIRFEFVSIQSPSSSEDYARGYRIFAAPANAPANETCLTKGIGYEWATNTISTSDPMYYDFDYATFEKSPDSQWLFPMDACRYATGTINDKTIDAATLNTLSRVAFSASDGGLYSAWLGSGSAPTALALPHASPFSLVASMTAATLDPYATWVSQNGASTLLTSGTADETADAYNKFLLNMDLTSTVSTQLTVTGLTTDTTAAGEKTVTLTVLPPDGTSLAAVADRARICLKRAATFAELATATPLYYEYATTLGSDGSATIALPVEENDVEKPFMQATLIALPSITSETTSSLCVSNE